MMKFLSILAILPLSALAEMIPVDHFDQTKLESVLRRIPSAFQKSEDKTEFVRKFYSFPATESVFKITCTADHYRSSPIPSNSECKLEVKGDKRGDEIQTKVTDASIAATLYSVMPVTSTTTRKVYSTERVYGQAYAGNYREVFRYMFVCTQSNCEITASTKEATE